MNPERIDVRQAHELMDKEKDAVYLDVRTEDEFAEGHPEGAINVPIGTPNPAMQRIDPNPDFLDVVRAAVPEHVPLIVGCKSGPRAAPASEWPAPSRTGAPRPPTWRGSSTPAVWRGTFACPSWRS